MDTSEDPTAAPPDHVEAKGMADDIHQARFALVSVLERAHEARPQEYADPAVLQAMADDALIAYAHGLLDSLDRAPRLDDVATELQAELRRILLEP